MIARLLLSFGIFALITYIGYKRGKPVSYKEYAIFMLALLCALTVFVTSLALLGWW